MPAPPADWDMFKSPVAVNHIAISMPNREAWLQQLAFLRSKGVKFHRRVNHGMTHSLYISDPNGYGVEVLYELPREVWDNDIQGALGYAEQLPTEGDEAFVDDTDYPTFGEEAAVVGRSLVDPAEIRELLSLDDLDRYSAAAQSVLVDRDVQRMHAARDHRSSQHGGAGTGRERRSEAAHPCRRRRPAHVDAR